MVAITELGPGGYPRPYVPSSVFSGKTLSGSALILGQLVVAAQQPPFHPGSFTRSAFPTTVAAPVVAPGSRAVVTRQEMPGHPASYVTSAASYNAPAVPTSGRQYVVHSFPTPMLVGETGRNSYVAGSVLLGETQGSAPAALTPETRRVTTALEQPRHPGSFTFGPPAYVAAQVASAEIRRAVTTREQPSHPTSFTSLTYPTTVAPPAFNPEVRRAITAIELPAQPFPITRSPTSYNAPAPPNVTGVLSFVVTWQEQPEQDHPRSFLQSPIFPLPSLVPTVGRFWSVRPQDPWHPGSFSFAGVAPTPPVFMPPGTRIVFTRAEVPFHPLPFTTAGIAFASLLAARRFIGRAARGTFFGRDD